tara:strand:+ start:71 stop:589 length:519 start_codon:yes stop_codon:yes gene_type:complete
MEALILLILFGILIFFKITKNSSYNKSEIGYMKDRVNKIINPSKNRSANESFMRSIGSFQQICGGIYSIIFLISIIVSEQRYGFIPNSLWFHLFIGAVFIINGWRLAIKYEKRTSEGVGYSDAFEKKFHDWLSNKQKAPSVADEIKKYKELFDSGAITEAEYNAKKKELLDL